MEKDRGIKKGTWESPGVPMARNLLSLPRAQVKFLVEELRSCSVGEKKVREKGYKKVVRVEDR